MAMINTLTKVALTTAGGIVGAVVGASWVGKKFNKKANNEFQRAEKHLTIMKVMNQWIIDLQDGKRLSSYFLENGYHSIAIYGMSYLGERLVDELLDSDVEVKYGIDRNAANIYTEIEVVTPDRRLDSVDVIVVASPFYYDEIERELSTKTKCPIISIEDVVYGV